MKRLLMLAVVLLAAGMTGQAWATIDWAGNVWPADGSNQVPTGPLSVYVQAYKAGVTDAAGQGADIHVELYYAPSPSGVYYAAPPSTYNGDVGNNDEYVTQIPQSALQPGGYVDVQIAVFDDTDGTFVVATGSGTDNYVRYNVTDVLPNDVQVGFRLCLSGTATSGGVCVVGSDAALGSWTAGVAMTADGGDAYSAQVVIPAGSNPTFEYKYQKDDCATWEGTPNRQVTLPTDGTTTYLIPNPDSWENLPIGCGYADVLGEDKTICFQVCLEGVGTSGGVCVTGNVPALTSWGQGVPMTEIGPGLYQACVVWPAGGPSPQNLEYKFRKDGCDTWETVGNRLFTLDDGAAAETTLTNNWDDGAGGCAVVPTEATSWSELKETYR